MGFLLQLTPLSASIFEMLTRLEVLKFIFTSVGTILSAGFALITILVYWRQTRILKQQSDIERKGRLPIIQTSRMRGEGQDKFLVQISNTGGGPAKDVCALVRLTPYSDISTGILATRRPVEKVLDKEDDGDRSWTSTEGNKLAGGEQNTLLRGTWAHRPSECDADGLLGFRKARRQLEQRVIERYLETFRTELDPEFIETYRDRLNQTVLETIEATPSEEPEERPPDVSLTDLQTFLDDCDTVGELDATSLKLSNKARLQLDLLYRDSFDEWNSEAVADVTFQVDTPDSIQEILETGQRTELYRTNPRFEDEVIESVLAAERNDPQAGSGQPIKDVLHKAYQVVG